MESNVVADPGPRPNYQAMRNKYMGLKYNDYEAIIKKVARPSELDEIRQAIKWFMGPEDAMKLGDVMNQRLNELSDRLISFADFMRAYKSAAAGFIAMRDRCVKSGNDWVCASYMSQMDFFINSQAKDSSTGGRGPLNDQLGMAREGYEIVKVLETKWKEYKEKGEKDQLPGYEEQEIKDIFKGFLAKQIGIDRFWKVMNIRAEVEGIPVITAANKKELVELWARHGILFDGPAHKHIEKPEEIVMPKPPAAGPVEPMTTEPMTTKEVQQTIKREQELEKRIEELTKKKEADRKIEAEKQKETGKQPPKPPAQPPITPAAPSPGLDLMQDEIKKRIAEITRRRKAGEGMAGEDSALYQKMSKFNEPEGTYGDKKKDYRTASYSEIHYLISTWNQGANKLRQLYNQIDTFTGITDFDKEILKEEISQRLQGFETFEEMAKDVRLGGGITDKFPESPVKKYNDADIPGRAAQNITNYIKKYGLKKWMDIEYIIHLTDLNSEQLKHLSKLLEHTPDLVAEERIKVQEKIIQVLKLPEESKVSFKINKTIAWEYADFEKVLFEIDSIDKLQELIDAVYNSKTLPPKDKAKLQLRISERMEILKGKVIAEGAADYKKLSLSEYLKKVSELKGDKIKMGNPVTRSLYEKYSVDAGHWLSLQEMRAALEDAEKKRLDNNDWAVYLHQQIAIPKKLDLSASITRKRYTGIVHPSVEILNIGEVLARADINYTPEEYTTEQPYINNRLIPHMKTTKLSFPVIEIYTRDAVDNQRPHLSSGKRPFTDIHIIDGAHRIVALEKMGVNKIPFIVYREPKEDIAENHYLIEEHADIGDPDEWVKSKGAAFHDEVRGAHHGQVDGTLMVYDTITHNIIVHIDYTLFEGNIYLDFVMVEPAHRRQGYATALLMKLKALNPGATVKWGMMTEEGCALKNNIEKGVAESRPIYTDINTKLIAEARKYNTVDEFIKNSFNQRYHQTSPEIAEIIEREGFSTAKRGSGRDDVLPIGVNIKSHAKDIGLKAEGKQIEVYYPKYLKEKRFETRNECELYFYHHNPTYAKAVLEHSNIDNQTARDFDIEWAKPDYDEQDKKLTEILEAGKKKLLVQAQIAQQEALKTAIAENIDVIIIDKDIGSFNRVTDNTIVLNPKALKTRSQLIDIWKTAQTTGQKDVIMERSELASVEAFIRYHYTGHIDSEAYNYNTVESLSWLRPEAYKIFVKTISTKKGVIQFRKSGEKLQYCRHNPVVEIDGVPTGGDIERDPITGLALHLTDAEIAAKGLPKTDTSIIAFNDKNQAVGFASNEFGADGVWVVDEYQKLGIGVELLSELRKQFPPERKMGQMTEAGVALAKAYYRRIKQEKPELMIRESGGAIAKLSKADIIFQIRAYRKSGKTKDELEAMTREKLIELWEKSPRDEGYPVRRSSYVAEPAHEYPNKEFYTSSAHTMTLKQFIETEVQERGNYSIQDVKAWQHRYNISDTARMVWVSPKKWVANRYNLPADEWDEAENVPESEMSVYKIKASEGTLIIESDDGEEGYLFVFNTQKPNIIAEPAHEYTKQERIKLAKSIAATMGPKQEAGITIDDMSGMSKEDRIRLAKKIASGEMEVREDDLFKDDKEDCKDWLFGDWESLLPGMEDYDDLEEMLDCMNNSDKLSDSEKGVLKERIEKMSTKLRQEAAR